MSPLNFDESMVLGRAEALDRIGWKTLAAALHAPETSRGAGVAGEKSLVAIIDSGVDPHIEWCKGRIVARHNANDGTEDIDDETGHGTALAGILLGNGKAGAGHGVAPGASMIVVKAAPVVLADGLSTGSVPTTVTIRALKWVAENRERIEAETGKRLGAVCLAAAGGPLSMTPPDGWTFTESGRAIRKLRDAGVLTVVGAGNSYGAYVPRRDGMHWPAILPACISVGATYDEDTVMDGVVFKADELTFYTNRILAREPGTTIFAPGSVLQTTGHNAPFSIVNFEGTSAATPVVCASVLLIQELYHQEYGTWPKAEEVIRLLTTTARQLTDRDGRPYRFLNLAGVAAAIRPPSAA